MIKDFNTTAQHILICSETQSKGGSGPLRVLSSKSDHRSTSSSKGLTLQEISLCKSHPNGSMSTLGRSP